MGPRLGSLILLVPPCIIPTGLHLERGCPCLGGGEFPLQSLNGTICLLTARHLGVYRDAGLCVSQRPQAEAAFPYSLCLILLLLLGPEQ